MDINEMFKLGMKRDLWHLIQPDMRCAVNLGAGNSPIPGTASLDWPDWDAEKMGLPYVDGSVTALFAFHFLEHLPGSRVIEMLREAERVLIPGGTFNIIVPHRSADLAFQDLDHKSFFTTETWRTLFQNALYDKHRERPWEFRIGTNCIIGVTERNLALMTQLIRTGGDIL